MTGPRGRTAARLQRCPAKGSTARSWSARPGGAGGASAHPPLGAAADLHGAVHRWGPLSPAVASIPDPWMPGDVCAPAENPAPEQYGSGADGMIKPPNYPSEQLKNTPVENLTYYDRYGMAGQYWYAVDMGCSDAMAMMGNAVANTVFTLVRAIDRTTISVYQAAASPSLLDWLKDTVDGVISDMGDTFNARYWSGWSSSARCGWPGGAWSASGRAGSPRASSGWSSRWRR